MKFSLSSLRDLRGLYKISFNFSPLLGQRSCNSRIELSKLSPKSEILFTRFQPSIETDITSFDQFLKLIFFFLFYYFG